MTRRRSIIAAIAVMGLAPIEDARAQSFPDRLIEFVIPAPPASSADIVGRMLLEGMAANLGQRLVAVNKPSAGGVVATAAVAQSKPDGYTLLHGAAWNLTVAPLTELHAPYTRRSFDAICQTFKNDQVIVARPDSYRNISELIAASKNKPGGLNYGTPAIASVAHLAMAELSQTVKAEFNHIPFRGPAEAIQMTQAGQIDFAVSPLTAAAASNLAKPGLFASHRNRSLPDVPTATEQGFDVAPLSIGGLYVPAGTPEPVKRKLEEACIASMQTDAFKRMANNTFQPSDFIADSAGFSSNLDKDMADKRRLLTSLGLAKN